MRHFHQAEAGFEAVRMVTYKTRPQFAARDQLAQIRHHLATVAHAQRQRLRTMEEGFEFVAHPMVKQNGFRPAFTRPQHVAVGKAAASHQRMEVAQTDTTAQQVAHMDVNRVKARTMERRRHLHVRVHPLLAQYSDFRSCACRNVRRGDIFINIKRQLHVEARIGIIRFRLVFLVSTLRIVAQTLHLPGRFRPPDTQRSAAFAEYRLVISGNHKAIASQGLTKVVDAVSKAVLRQQRFDRVSVFSAYLNHAAQLLVEQCSQMVIAQRGDIDLHAAVAGKGHLGQRHQQTAVGTVVPGQ